MLSRVASWHHGSSVSVILTPMRRRNWSSAPSVIFGNSVVRSLGMRVLPVSALGVAERFPVDLARWRPRQLGHERDLTRVLVLAQPRARERLKLARERVV